MAALFSLNQMQTKEHKKMSGPKINPTHHDPLELDDEEPYEFEFEKEEEG